MSVGTLLAASEGGHLRQLVLLASRMDLPQPWTWFTANSDQARSLLNDGQWVTAHKAPSRGALQAGRNAWLLHKIAADRSFDFAVSTGASIAVSVLPIMRFYGARAIFIESATRVDGPSLSGRFLARVPGVELYNQSRTWADGKWRYAGSVFDSFEVVEVPRDEGLKSVFVSLGTQGYPFHRLLARLSKILPDGVRVEAQVGSTDSDLYDTRHVSLDENQMAELMKSADVVVCHAGTGIALSCLEAGKVPVMVPRIASRGEHVDDHQEQIARFLVGRGLAVVTDADELTMDHLIEASRKTARRTTRAPQLDIST